jgi:4'-phosphopantetheinyl transferase EntD
LIRSILPTCLASAEAYGDVAGAELLAAEEAAIGKASEARRREYATVRHCARTALHELGVPRAAIVSGPDREPRWPTGIVGSMTHCTGYRAAAVGRLERVAAVGIDAERHEALAKRLRGWVLRPDETTRLDALAVEFPDVHWDRVVFSAKESVYKVWFPLARRRLGFKDAEVVIEPGPVAARGTFTALVHRPGLEVDGRPVTRLDGHWLVRDSLIATSIVIERAR